MSNLIEILDSNVDVNPILAELDQWSNDWKVNTARQDNNQVWEHTENILLIGGKVSDDRKLCDEHRLVTTYLVTHYPNTLAWIAERFPLPENQLQRTMFIKLFPGLEVHPHTDAGSYYRERQRYLLSIAGRYDMHVGDESMVMEPGVLLTFDNQATHWSKNLEDTDRVILVFDIYHTMSP